MGIGKLLRLQGLLLVLVPLEHRVDLFINSEEGVVKFALVAASLQL